MKWIFGLCLLLFLPCLLGGEEISVTPSVQFYDRYGIGIGEILSSNHTYYIPLTLDNISPWLVAAAVAAEDKRFFEHNGVDSAAILRAFYQNAKEGKVVSGASTITQQLVRTLKPHKKNLWGKLSEAAKATITEHQSTKEEILEQYLNLIEFGNLTQGVEAASRFYFGLSASDVSLSQAAFLAGLIKSPTYYNPLKHFIRAKSRRDYVLKRMYEEGLISEEMYRLAVTEELTISAKTNPSVAPHFVQLIKSFVPSGQTSVYTTLDSELQSFVAQTLKTHIQQLEQQHVTNGAVVVIENATGAILAYVGSADFNNAKNQGQIDGVRALRQPGSALKPFVYGLTFEKNLLTPASLIDDSDTFFKGGFRPRNYDEDFHGPVSVRQALACSYNIPAVKAAELVGVPSLLAFLKQNGLDSLTRRADFYGLGLSLGNGEVKLLDLTNAYATLARGGMKKPLQLASLPMVLLADSETRVLSEQSAFLITDILKDNQARSNAFGLNSPLYVPFEMAAKTGTSKDYKDNFALGYTPRWTIGVWVGNFDASPMQKVSGITGAGPVLHETALFLNQKYPSSPFKEPSGVVKMSVCLESGLLAGKNCTHIGEAIFSKNHIPNTCTGMHTPVNKPLEIRSPIKGDIFQLDPSVTRISQAVTLEAACAQEACYWTVDGKFFSKECKTWWPLQAGKHIFEVTCNGETARTNIEVLE